MKATTELRTSTRANPDPLRPLPNHDVWARQDKEEVEINYLVPDNEFLDRIAESAAALRPPDPALIGSEPVHAGLDDGELSRRADAYGVDRFWETKGRSVKTDQGEVTIFGPIALSLATGFTQPQVRSRENHGRIPTPPRIDGVRVFSWRTVMLAQLIAYEVGLLWDFDDVDAEQHFCTRVTETWLAS